MKVFIEKKENRKLPLTAFSPGKEAFFAFGGPDMARIPDEELQRIKSQVKLEDLCRDYGIELNRMGPDNLMGRCPFHDDQTPSFGVTPSKNLWNCLAGCGGGDVISWSCARRTSPSAGRWKSCGSDWAFCPKTRRIETRSGTTHPVLVPPSETELADHVLLKHVLDFYHQTFCDEVKAMRYLQERRCFDAEAVKVFQIGYANRTLGYRVPATTAAGKRLKEQLQRLGVIRDSGHEHLSGSVVFPILDEHGNVAADVRAQDHARTCGKGTPLHLYLPGEHRAVWNAAALRAGGGQKEWLLCESIIDALTLCQAPEGS